MESGNNEFYCGSGVPQHVTLDEVEELASSETLLIGNRVRMALRDYAKLLRSIQKGASDEFTGQDKNS